MTAKRSQRKVASPKAGRPALAEAAELRDQLARALRERDHQRFVLKLYVTGTTHASREAIERVRAVCDQHLHGRYELEVIDIYQLPSLARDEQIVATPTLIKLLPAPLRRFVGNLANVERVLFGLGLTMRPP
jgi:circadian clock protein KaiB